MGTIEGAVRISVISAQLYHSLVAEVRSFYDPVTL